MYSRRVPIFINIKVMKILDDIFVENIFQSFVPTFLKTNIEAYKLFSFFKTSPRRSDEKKLKRIVESSTWSLGRQWQSELMIRSGQVFSQPKVKLLGSCGCSGLPSHASHRA